MQLIKHTRETYHIKAGDAVAFLVLVPIQSARIEEEIFTGRLLKIQGQVGRGGAGTLKSHHPKPLRKAFKDYPVPPQGKSSGNIGIAKNLRYLVD